MTYPSKSGYGATLPQIANLLEPDEGEDPTHLIAIYLGLAYQQLQKIDRVSLLGPGERDLLIPHLFRAWRDLLYLRMQLDPESLDYSLLTRFGAISDAISHSDPGGTTADRDLEDPHQSAEGDRRPRSKTRHRRRRVTKRRGAKRERDIGITW